MLEVGNVLSHYRQTDYLVIDKFERGTNVLNVDVVDYACEEGFPTIVSISTLEHVGWDEDPFDSADLVCRHAPSDSLVQSVDEQARTDPCKAWAAIQHLRTMLTLDGQMLVTMPYGHNPSVDKMIRNEEFDVLWEGFLCRASRKGVGPAEWNEQARPTVTFLPYSRNTYTAQTVWIGCFTSTRPVICET